MQKFYFQHKHLILQNTGFKDIKDVKQMANLIHDRMLLGHVIIRAVYVLVGREPCV